MADIAAGDVTYTEVKKLKRDDGYIEALFDVAFGDGALTYPAGGVPLTRASLACPNYLGSLLFVDEANANGFVYKFDATNLKIRIYQGEYTAGADADLIELAGGAATPALATLRCQVIGW